MTDFQAVNATPNAMDQVSRLEPSTPTTPRPSVTTFTPGKSAQISSEVVDMEDVAKTPTKDSFAALATQKALPTSPLLPHARSDSKMEAPATLKREGSHKLTRSIDITEDTEMGDAKDEEDESDEDSVDGERPSKKKKGQRFFCTDFPPCHLSFTRSEHLARHIRKHTGERPFQCHCSRRFSRLDNLRQHAQTVHVNEDIPTESLAATGTRFQRQIRTDRVRPPGSRSRASTLSSGGGLHSRGHSRNLSSSSITSMASTASSLGGEDIMRRSTPVLMSEHGHRSRLSLDTYGSNITGSPGQHLYYPVGAQSPSGYSTPTSTTFGHGPGSPRYSSGFQSPVTIPRSVNFEPRTPAARRLSVPSAAAFSPSNNSPYHSSVHSASGGSSMFASPYSSYGHSRAESSSSIDVELKRRTWHPAINTGLVPRPGTSGLQQWQTPEQSRPLFPAEKVTAPSTAASGPPRLPGIESFDHAPPPPPAPRVLSPMQIDTPQRQSLASAMAQRQSQHGNNRLSWDSSQRGLSMQELERASQQAEQGQASFGPVTTQEPVRPSTSHVTFVEPPTRRSFEDSRSRLSGAQATPSRKRMAWYNGPVQQPAPNPAFASVRTSPDDSGSSDGLPTPSIGSQGEAHPAVMHSNGYIEHRPHHIVHEVLKMQPPPPHHAPSYNSNAIPQYLPFQHPPHSVHNAAYALQQAQQAPPPPAYQRPPSAGNDMQRLEALVAVATRENQAVSGQ